MYYAQTKLGKVVFMDWVKYTTLQSTTAYGFWVPELE